MTLLSRVEALTGPDRALELDHTLSGVRTNAVHEALRGHAMQNDYILKQLLGQWVSELEPTIFADSDGRIAGIGGDKVVIWAPGHPRKERTLRDILTGPVFR